MPGKSILKLAQTVLKMLRPLLSVRWGLRLLITVTLLDIGYIWGITPDWRLYAQNPIQKTRFIESYEHKRMDNQAWPALQWQPVPLRSIPEHVVRAVIVAEDSRFFHHNGVDEQALRQALEYNLSKGQLVYGGSTISQQTVKNLFFTPSRNPLRKWHELMLTYIMEWHLSKRRILEIYLNVVEFGRGIYGVEAAARFYWGKPVRRLSSLEAAELAATLPAPVLHNPLTRTKYFIKHRNKIRRHLVLAGK